MRFVAVRHAQMSTQRQDEVLPRKNRFPSSNQLISSYLRKLDRRPQVRLMFPLRKLENIPLFNASKKKCTLNFHAFSLLAVLFLLLLRKSLA